MSTLNSPARLWLLVGALLGGLAVALGAFGAHGLESHLRGPDGSLTAAAERSMAVWETAARYQMYHALALLAVGVLNAADPKHDRSVRRLGDDCRCVDF